MAILFFFIVCWISPDSGSSIPASIKCYNLVLVSNQEDSAWNVREGIWQYYGQMSFWRLFPPDARFIHALLLLV